MPVFAIVKSESNLKVDRGWGMALENQCGVEATISAGNFLACLLNVEEFYKLLIFLCCFM